MECMGPFGAHEASLARQDPFAMQRLGFAMEMAPPNQTNVSPEPTLFRVWWAFTQQQTEEGPR